MSVESVAFSQQEQKLQVSALAGAGCRGGGHSSSPREHLPVHQGSPARQSCFSGLVVQDHPAQVVAATVQRDDFRHPSPYDGPRSDLGGDSLSFRSGPDRFSRQRGKYFLETSYLLFLVRRPATHFFIRERADYRLFARLRRTAVNNHPTLIVLASSKHKGTEGEQPRSSNHEQRNRNRNRPSFPYRREMAGNRSRFRARNTSPFPVRRHGETYSSW